MFLTVVELKSITGGTGHVITIFDYMIFDAACKNALPLSTDALDYCCSTDTITSKFNSVYHGFHFEEQQRDKQHRWKAHLMKQAHLSNHFQDDDESI
jgi:hypothetical protein